MSSAESLDGSSPAQPNTAPWQIPVSPDTITNLIQLVSDSVPPALGRVGFYMASFYGKSEDKPIGGALDHRAALDRPDHSLLVTLSQHHYDPNHTGEIWVWTTHYDIKNTDDGRSITRRREYGEYNDLEYGSSKRPGIIRAIKAVIDRERRPRPAINPFVSQVEAQLMLERFRSSKVFGAPEDPAYWSGPRFNAGD